MGGRSCGSCLYHGQALAYGTLTRPNLQKPLRCSRSASPLNEILLSTALDYPGRGLMGTLLCASGHSGQVSAADRWPGFQPCLTP